MENFLSNYSGTRDTQATLPVKIGDRSRPLMKPLVAPPSRQYQITSVISPGWSNSTWPYEMVILTFFRSPDCQLRRTSQEESRRPLTYLPQLTQCQSNSTTMTNPPITPPPPATVKNSKPTCAPPLSKTTPWSPPSPLLHRRESCHTSFSLTTEARLLSPTPILF